MSSELADFQDNEARISKERRRRLERRRREQLRRKANNWLTRFSSTDGSERFDPRNDAIPLRSTPQRTRRGWRRVNEDCLKLIEDCQEIIGRLQNNVNHISNNHANLLNSASNCNINHGNLLQISPETQPETQPERSLRDMLEHLHHNDHYQPIFKTSQIIERLMSSSHASSSLCPLQNIEVSLVCPLSQTKIKIPIRGKQCMHLGCCDGITFLSLVEGKPPSRWKCPTCSLPMPYEDIRVDGMISNIISKVKEDVTKIEFTSSTTWRVKEEKGPSSSTTHKLNKNKKEIIDLTNSPLPKAEGIGSECHLIDLTDSP